MATRPVFVPDFRKPFYKVCNTDFVFCPGFSSAQKQRSIDNLHTSFLNLHPEARILEISTKSPTYIGVELSAFNLQITLENGDKVPLECAFQAGKVFENGGPYLDLLYAPPYLVKKDERLKNSGKIISFEFEGKTFPNVPKTFFYNWLYIKALTDDPGLSGTLAEYSAFTDIEFNPLKSLNCQAMAAAIFVGLKTSGRLEQAIESPEAFLETVYS